MIFQDQFEISTRGRGTYDITGEINSIVRKSGVNSGICHVFLQHTSASLILCENADPVVHRDLESFMSRLIPDGDPLFEHTDEGPDDMPAHVRTILTKSDLNLPVTSGRCNLGVWQSVYLYDHRTHGHRRRVVVTIYGE